MRHVSVILQKMVMKARKHVTIEYVMLEGVNDQPEHAQQLLKLLKTYQVKLT